jgi:predicted nucleic acid-binding Zn ribbon protein
MWQLGYAACQACGQTFRTILHDREEDNETHCDRCHLNQNRPYWEAPTNGEHDSALHGSGPDTTEDRPSSRV